MPQNESEMNKRRMVRLSNEAAGQLTRECLQTALIRLLAEQEMDKISITELVRVAGVSRTAFYSNYNSKEEVLLDWVSSYLSELQSMMVGAVRTHNLQGVFEQIFEQILSGEKEFALLMKGNLQNHFSESINTYMLQKYSDLNDDAKLLLTGWCGMMINILLFWYRDDMKKPAREMADLCSSLTAGFVRRMKKVCPDFFAEEEEEG